MTADVPSPARRRRWRARFLVLALSALAFASAQRTYYPSTLGTSWTYSNGETQTLSSGAALYGDAFTILTHYVAGVPISEEVLYVGPEGTFIVGTASGGSFVTYDPPLTVYPPGPLAPGDGWQSTTVVSGLEITVASEVVGVQGVRTPAGRFNALQIRQTTLTSSGARTTIDLFFVPTVGVVRFVTSDGVSTDLVEVFHPGER